MLLNDSQLARQRFIEPFSGVKIKRRKDYACLSYGASSFGYDISLSAKRFQIFQESLGVVNPKNFDPAILFDAPLLRDDFGEFFILPPKSNALGLSVEYFNIPDNVLGVAVGKSTYARCGVFVNITPLEPGWKGYLVVELFNALNAPCRIYAKEGIAQILFHQGSKPNQVYAGKYQNQDSLTYAKA